MSNGFIRKRLSKYLSLDEDTISKTGGIELGSNISGIIALREAASGLPNESGISEVVPPGSKKHKIASAESLGGIIETTPELLQVFPPMPSYKTEQNGMAKMIPIAIGVGIILLTNLQKEDWYENIK